MLWHFNRYFIRYLFFKRTRQRLLLLGLLGLVISSFALLVLQSTMGGLQNNLVKRSYRAEGTAVLEFKNREQDFVREVLRDLRNRGITAFAEYEIELLLRHDGHISPVVLHGVDFSTLEAETLLEETDPHHLPTILPYLDQEVAAMGLDLARKIRVRPGSQISLISPSHTNPMLGDVPRQVTASVGPMVATDVPQVDMFHLWTRLGTVQNLIRKHHLNRIRLFSPHDFSELRASLAKQYPEGSFQLRTWEEKNSSLVFALRLETSVMTFLFICMTFLVALAITSGFLIFFNKIRPDLLSFWVLGGPKRKLEKYSTTLVHLVSIMATGLGLGIGLGFLWVLDNYAPDIMPSIFIETRIPVFITPRALLISFFVPYFVSVIFAHLTIRSFRKNEGSYLEVLRAVGQIS